MAPRFANSKCKMKKEILNKLYEQIRDYKIKTGKYPAKEWIAQRKAEIGKNLRKK